MSQRTHLVEIENRKQERSAREGQKHTRVPQNAATSQMTMTMDHIDGSGSGMYGFKSTDAAQAQGAVIVCPFKRMMLCESSAMQQEILCFSVEQVVTTAACKTCGVRFPRCLVTFRANVATTGWQKKKI